MGRGREKGRAQLSTLHAALYTAVLHSHPTLSTNEVQLVHYEEADTLNILPLLPPPRQHVPVLWSTDDNVALLPRRVNHEGWRVRGEEVIIMCTQRMQYVSSHL